MPRNGRAQRQVPNFWIGAGWDEVQIITVAEIQPAAAMSATASETFTLTVGSTQAAAAMEATVPSNFTLEVATEQAAPSMGVTLPYFENAARRTVAEREGIDAANKEDPAYKGYAFRKGPHRAP